MSEEETKKDLSVIDYQKQELQKMDDMAEDIIKNADETNEKANDMYQYFQDLIDLEADKSDATREMMGKALGIKIDSNMQKIELLKIKAKLLNPGKAQTSVNINLGDYDQKKGSDTNDMISIVDNLRNE